MDPLKAENTKTQPTKLMKQRTLWAMLSTMSRPCNLKKSDNTAESGVIHTLCKKGVILVSKADSLSIKSMIPFDKIISLECPNIQNIHKNKFQTDQEISKHSRIQKRQLQQWQGEEQSSLTFDVKDYKGWNQFEINAAKFGVVSTYDENLYTTPVPHISELTEEQVLRAKIVEKEINSFTQEKDEKEEDEEALFGAVLGSGRYNVVKQEVNKNVKVKSEEKEKYKKFRKGLETGKKVEENDIVDERVESLNLILPKVEVTENVKKSFQMFKESMNLQEKVSVDALKEFSKEISPKISFMSRKNSEATESKPVVVEPKIEIRSVLDLYITTWKNALKITSF